MVIPIRIWSLKLLLVLSLFFLQLFFSKFDFNNQIVPYQMEPPGPAALAKMPPRTGTSWTEQQWAHEAEKQALLYLAREDETEQNKMSSAGLQSPVVSPRGGKCDCYKARR